MCDSETINEFGFELESTRIYQDNALFIECATGGAGRNFNKHKKIYVRHSYIMSLLKDGQITLIRTERDEISANLLTKALLPDDLLRAVSAAELFV